MQNVRIHKALTMILILLGMAVLYWFVKINGIDELIADIDSLIIRLRESDSIGPLIIIGLMLLAVVFNPLPSAPIALASGAVYGHTWGTVYIIIGALSGAIMAFMIARLTGHQFIQKITQNSRWKLGRLGSQNALMGFIFVSRLIPFISFDLVSYAAGLTSITLWRFFFATLFGLIPASFLLAHFGGEIVEANLQSITLWVLIAGVITVPPILYGMFTRQKQAETQDRM